MVSYQHQFTRFIIMSVRIFAKPGWVWFSTWHESYRITACGQCVIVVKRWSFLKKLSSLLNISIWCNKSILLSDFQFLLSESEIQTIPPISEIPCRLSPDHEWFITIVWKSINFTMVKLTYKYIFGLTRGCFKNNFILNEQSTEINEIFAQPTSLISFHYIADDNLIN